jgi:UDP-N-acetylmuramoyl-L-alanyl-D-glutamate--2,6-diaminopimelate ligase|tara:strand:- start:2244 stop:3695 length:1452 start_codon:yes stop_codon:yes gene_type:complete
MTPIEINKVLEGIATPHSSLNGVKVLGITSDSRQVSNGYIFIAINGNECDGNEFIDQAITDGAICIISDSDKIEPDINIIKVKNTRKILGVLASNFYNNPQESIQLIGVTGTNGKTSTTTILKNILEASGNKVIQIGTLGILPKIFDIDFELTTPSSIDIFRILHEAVNKNYDFAILEVSSHALSQNRVNNISFDYAGFTNLSLDHLDYHGNIKNYFNEKKKLFTMVKNNGSSMVLADSSFGKEICDEYKNTKTVSLKNMSADFFCKDFELNHSFTNAEFNFKGSSFKISSSLIGNYNLQNIILAASIAFEVGTDINSIQKGIKSCKSIPGRYEFIKNKGKSMIVSDYGHTPDAYENVLQSISEVYKNKNIKILFGAGGNRDKSKRPEMAKAIERFATQCYLAPDNPRLENIHDINSDVIKGFSKNIFQVFDKRENALKAALSEMSSNDILIIFGKGIEEYQDINGERIFYSDREIIRDFYES